MHEMSIAASMLRMAEEEAAKAGCSRIDAVVVKYGQLSGIMPEALELAFAALIKETPHAGARLALELVPLRARCVFCGCVFGGDFQGVADIVCPKCGEIFGHAIEQGKELILARIEASP